MIDAFHVHRHVAFHADNFVATRNNMDNEKCLELIRLYGEKKVLWNTKLAEYHNKTLREDAWRDISAKMGIDVAILKKKMTVLLSSYRREKWRMSKSLTTGSGDYNYMYIIYYYNTWK